MFCFSHIIAANPCRIIRQKLQPTLSVFLKYIPSLKFSVPDICSFRYRPL